MPHDPRPVGVFDSGIGGLTILRELLTALPDERFVYFGDDANCPYGPRPEHEVRALALAAARFLLTHDVKAIVVACNAASVSAREVLRATFPEIPIVVVVPAVKPAAALTRSGKIILAATARAINDRFTHGLIHDFAAGVEVISVACPGLVELVERGELTGPGPEAVIADYFRPALDQGADVVVLGCTHFPALRAAVEQVVGPQVAVIDSGAAVARQTQHVLEELAPLPHGRESSPATNADRVLRYASAGSPPSSLPTAVERGGNGSRVSFYTSGDPERFSRVASMVMGTPVQARHGMSDVRWEKG